MSHSPITFSPKKLAQLFRVLGQPSHLEILLAIGTGEACVCHLEAATGWRQAYLSQHLMALRSEGPVMGRREGRNIFYPLKNAAVLDVIRQAASLAGKTDVEAALTQLAEPLAHCPCPHCNGQTMRAPVRKVARRRSSKVHSDLGPSAEPKH
jgi:ArsR family transcriptional regulator, arsenate/arsenite/antimonite-responsive transcriptional repressor